MTRGNSLRRLMVAFQRIFKSLVRRLEPAIKCVRYTDNLMPLKVSLITAAAYCRLNADWKNSMYNAFLSHIMQSSQLTRAREILRINSRPHEVGHIRTHNVPYYIVRGQRGC